MQIAFDARPLTGPYGGVRRYASDLLRALARVDGENEYVVCGANAELAEEPLGDTFRLCPDRYPYQRWLDQIRLTGARRDVDLYHGTNYTVPLFGRVPRVLTVHDLSVELLPRTHPFKRRLRHRLLPRLCRRAARVIADSKTTKKDLVRWFGVPWEKIDVIYLAAGAQFRRVSSPEELSRTRRRHGLPERFVLYVGSIEPRKNLPALLRSAGELKRDGAGAPVVLAGRAEPAYLAIIRSALQDAGLVEGEDVLLLGPVDDEELPALYSLCTVFAYPSLYEGFGLPPMEAMACGAPVLISDTAALKELYEETCEVAELKRPGSLTARLEALLEDPSRRAALAERGEKHARARTWEDIACETLEVYRRAAGTR